MHFGLKKIAFNNAMMQFLRDNWILLFEETKRVIILDNSPSTGICDNIIIIDDVLLFYNHLLNILYYFSCVARVFTKYKLLFKLNK